MSKDDELLSIVHAIFEDRIPFNKLLGLTVESLTIDHACLKFSMRDELIGNFVRSTLHGGVISAALDVTGGLVAFLGVLKNLEGQPIEKKIERFTKVGTIDLRVDFLRPGAGKEFFATGFVLRTGNKVAVTRMELQNDEGQVIAVGTGAYIIG